MRFLPLIYCALLVSTGRCGELTLTVDPTTGSYVFGGTISLLGGPTTLRSNGQVLSTSDNTLILDNAPTALQGTDPTFGPFTGFEMTYNQRLFTTRIKEFTAGDPGQQLFIFEQHFAQGVNGTSAHPGGNETDDSYALSSSFPTLVLPPAPWLSPAAPNLTAACFSGGWLDPLPDWPMPSQVWRFNNASLELGSALGFMGSAVAIFDGALNVLALSPLDNFFTTHAAADNSTLGVGVSARVESLPPGFTSRTIVLGGSGINDTVFALGSALLALGGKPRLAVQDVEDISLKYISSWHDNGAYCAFFFFNGMARGKGGAYYSF